MSNYASYLYTGPGFGAIYPIGFLYYLDYWLTLSGGSGGAGWYVIEDGSTLIDKSFNPSTAITASPTNTITIPSHGLVTGQKVTFDTAIGGFWTDTVYFVRRVDSSTIKLYTTIGKAIDDTSALTLNVPGSVTVHLYSCPYKVYSNVSVPVLNNNSTKFVEIWYDLAHLTRASINAHLWWDSTNHISRGVWSGASIQLSTAGTTYFSGDINWLMIMSSIVAADSFFIIDDWTYNIAGYEAASKIGTVTNTPAAGRNVTIILGTGQAANFTPGKYYYIYDLDGHSQVEYVLCMSSDGNTIIVVDPLTYSYPAGAIIGSYPHRFCTSGYATGDINSYYGNSSPGMNVPYYSVYTRTISSTPCERIFHNQYDRIYSYCTANVVGFWDTTQLDNERIIVQRHLMSEYKDGLGSGLARSKILGTPNHMYLCNGASLMTRFVDTISIGGVSYMYVGSSSTYKPIYPTDASIGFLMPLA